MTWLFLPLLALVSANGLAGGLMVHVHPDASRVMFASPRVVQVCGYFDTGPNVSPNSCEWGCAEYDSAKGASGPVTLDLPCGGPVRIQGARWAWFEDQFGQWIPMAGFQTEFVE